MVLESVYICRHGFRLSWETSVWSSPTGIPRDPPLSAHGVDQAKELARFLKQELGVESAEDARKQGIVLLSSPLYRCVQTATPTAEALGVPIFIEPGIGEWYLPVRRGLHPELATASFLSRFFPLVSTTDPSSPDSAGWTPLLTPPRTGESMRAVHARARTLWTAHLVSALEARGAKKIVLFSHAATCIALVRALAGDLEDLAGAGGGEAGEGWDEEKRRKVRAATCSVSKFVREGRGAGGEGSWKWEWDGRTDFLSRGEERHWDFTYVEEYVEDGLVDGKEVSATKSDNYKNLPTAAPKETRANEAGQRNVQGRL
ncbi:hypothetical protein Rhopal_004929-T1 [Rhodotorula paludigena]|uniref:Phosphoglycerate mutase-like protein n=1 Tax=Rhodotorula paludigena TaxID=86838 RepID=A0AAV5GPQ3_9BASI|nr:hypothetical protein Rhopal_004929-T1 [Rhodotorula paludigena]